jgi:cell division septum initiation protein DivIVA
MESHMDEKALDLGPTGPSNEGPPSLNKIGELSARGIDRISIETADQIREVGEAAVTHAEAIRAEANALADSILEQGRRFSDRVAAFTSTAETMLQSMNEQRGRLHKMKGD